MNHLWCVGKILSFSCDSHILNSLQTHRCPLRWSDHLNPWMFGYYYIFPTQEKMKRLNVSGFGIHASKFTLWISQLMNIWSWRSNGIFGRIKFRNRLPSRINSVNLYFISLLASLPINNFDCGQFIWWQCESGNVGMSTYCTYISVFTSLTLINELGTLSHKFFHHKEIQFMLPNKIV